MQISEYNELKKHYEALREKAHREAEQRREQLYAEIPRLYGLAEQRRQLTFEQGLKILQQPQNEPAIRASVQKELENLQAEELKILNQAGLPADHLKPHYCCQACEDTGFVGEGLQKPCSCFEQRKLEREYRSSNITNLEQSFENFNLEIFPEEPVQGNLPQRQYMEKIRRICLTYADSFPDTKNQNLLFSGLTGLGKSFLLNAIAKRVLERGHSVLKLTAYNLFDSILQSIKKTGLAQTRPFIETELLLIDDLGSEPQINNITTEYLFSLINERISANRHTIIATNLLPNELQQRYGERVYSRLLDPNSSQFFLLQGKDVRLNKR